jgi:membrane protease YdiL (CAAX protease family)
LASLKVSPVEGQSPHTDGIDSPAAFSLTLKHGILAVVVMYAAQIIAGVGISSGLKLITPEDAAPREIYLIGLLSILTAGLLVLLVFWLHSLKVGKELFPQINLKPSSMPIGQALRLVFTVLVLTHVFAWVYRSLFLPIVGHAGVVGGGSQMFDYVSETGSVSLMIAFLSLALFVGPVMEEVVFRGYLQSSLSRKLPSWAALSVTSLVFMAGHSPVVLWPMYFIYSMSWGWVMIRTGSLRMAILVHVLSNLFYAIVGFARWEILA